MAEDWKKYWNPYKPELAKVYEEKAYGARCSLKCLTRGRSGSGTERR